MGLFDSLKKNLSGEQKYSMSLESLLQRAITEPAFRADFYKSLLTANLFVISPKSDIPDGRRTLQEGSTVNLVSLPDGNIPVFTSTERIFDNNVIQEEMQYLQMNGRDLFELAKGASFILNPYSDYGKELLSDEVEKILDGTILTESTKTMTIGKSTEVLVGQPANYPSEMISSLKKLFAERPSIKKAYLGWIHNPKSEDPPHYIFGIDADRDFQDLIPEAGFAAKQYLRSDEFVDFIKIDKGGVSDYLVKNTKPFYEK